MTFEVLSLHVYFFLEELHVSSDNEFADMFETPPSTSSSKDVGTSS